MQEDQTSGLQDVQFALHSKEWKWSWEGWSGDAPIQPGDQALNSELRNKSVLAGLWERHTCTL